MSASKIIVFFTLFFSAAVFSQANVTNNTEDDDGSITIDLGGGLGTVVALSPEDKKLFKERMKHLQEKGYINREHQPAKIDLVLDYIKTRIIRANAEGLPMQQNRGLTIVAERMDSDTRFLELPFTPINIKYKNTKNKGYIFVDGNRLHQVHTDTKFGTLMIEEFGGVDNAFVRDSNVEVLGYPGKLSHIKYQDQKWSTVLFLPHQNKLILMECDKKLNVKSKELFLQLAEDLITNI